jgi:RNA polymerase sigma-70 factor, ECF subfamily
MATSGTSTPLDVENWLDMHGDALYRYALLQLRDEHKAEEMVQETLVAALQARDRYRGGAAVRTWLIGILKHKMLDQFRREAREAPLEESFLGQDEADDETAEQFKSDGHWQSRLGDWGHPEAAVESSQFWEILQRCIDLLPKKQARLFMLRELMEEKTEKICKELSITPTNLWTMLYRTRMGLRKCLDRNWVGEARA